MQPGKRKFPEIDLRKLSTTSLSERTSLVKAHDFAGLVMPGSTVRELLDSLPNILAGRRLRRLASAIADAHRSDKLVAAGIGAHVIKCGLAPIVIDLMQKRILNALAINGAAAIHDYEIASIGATSEDVKTALQHGSFGTARQTAHAFRKAISQAKRTRATLGEALGDVILEETGNYKELSVLAFARKLDIPVTVHLAWGTDIVHMHPDVLGQDLGGVCARDFKKFCAIVASLQDGVWLNIGSAVVLPEVFLKAFAVAKNLGYKLDDVTTANLDMLQHYRPRMNVLERPAKSGISITCHHELLLPLLRLAILTELEHQDKPPAESAQ